MWGQRNYQLHELLKKASKYKKNMIFPTLILKNSEEFMKKVFLTNDHGARRNRQKETFIYCQKQESRSFLNHQILLKK
jgi:hypothetical protein